MSKINEPVLAIPLWRIHSCWKFDLVVAATVSAMTVNNFRHADVNYFTIPILCEYIFGTPDDTPERNVEMAVHRMELDRRITQVSPGLYAVKKEVAQNYKGHVLIPIRVFRRMRDGLANYSDVLMIYSFLMWRRSPDWNYDVGETSLAEISGELSCPFGVVRDSVSTLIDMEFIAVRETRNGFLYAQWEYGDVIARVKDVFT